MIVVYGNGPCDMGPFEVEAVNLTDGLDYLFDQLQ